MTDERPASPGLTCYRCGRTATFPARKRCECGEPLWFVTDDAATEFAWPESGTGVWRYADLLPVGPHAAERPDAYGRAGVGAAAGATPLVRAPTLDADAGCRLWLKDESENPTGSFKDRGSAVGAAWAAEAGREWIGTVSYGNMAISVAANAAGIGGPGGGDGPDALVLVPDDISGERLAAIAQYDPEVLRVAGDYGRLYYETLDADAPVEFVNSDTPLRVAGQKTTALEICEAFASASEALDLAGRAPDAIVLPVSSGGHASATWKALRELRTAGLLADEDLPQLYFVQAAACDPIAEAYREGDDEVSSTEQTGSTVAYSIANSDPPSGTRALTAARQTGGAVLSVPDDEILEAKADLARNAGFCVEPASATTLAGVRRLSEAGELAESDEVVAVLTGTGFRELDAAGAKPEAVELADLPGRLGDLVG
ncbi:threonine synthase [Halorussus salinisoli]|uniref:threonine synthase n=1 Tax=Halorussus salinisoli TaxID=2558242 RepID=UPI0010C23C04|nr:pyridoxal-phosphate dependent enzyme [Halorussus salinisoli]